MDQLIRLRQYVEALDSLPGTDGDEGPRSMQNDMLTSHGEGDEEVTRLTRSVARCMGRFEQALRRQRRFASDASHELRGPITGLRARLEEARLHPDQTRMDDLIEDTLSDVKRLESIITDMLMLSRFEATGSENGNGGRKVKAIDLAELVASEVARRPDRLANELRLEPGVIVMGARGELAQVLANLLDNAQRHADSTVTIGVRRDGDGAELIVSDDGDGIDAADRERIFKRFVRLDASRERDSGGTGLGLAICREIAHAHHGTLEVGGSAGGGARFVLRLPCARRDAH
ncbi:sensor histidine kinase [Actinomadura rugatobispora]|uniref:histidine kinase n=1 Tax=Actinomadura rugatobispora TaxID=1994 RepID=A0ABW1AIU4_9ACTN|nr:hypothetical protein GCM10010200_092600 [Actinomadura rugatobispora]